MKHRKIITMVMAYLVMAFSPTYAYRQETPEAYQRALQQARQAGDHAAMMRAIAGLRGLEQNDPDLYFYEAEAYRIQGDGINAQNLYNRYLREQPLGDHAEAAYRGLDALIPLLANTYKQLFTTAVKQLEQPNLPENDKIKAFQTLVDAGEASGYAMEKLCLFYTAGHLVERSESFARDYCEKAAQFEVDNSFFHRTLTGSILAHMQRYGYGGLVNIDAAKSYYQSRLNTADNAQEKGKYQSRLAELYIYGNDTPDCAAAQPLVPNSNSEDRYDRGLLFKLNTEPRCPAISNGVKLDPKTQLPLYAKAVSSLIPILYYLENNKTFEVIENNYCLAEKQDECSVRDIFNDFYKTYISWNSTLDPVELKRRSVFYYFDIPYPMTFYPQSFAKLSYYMAGLVTYGHLQSSYKPQYFIDKGRQFGPDYSDTEVKGWIDAFRNSHIGPNYAAAATYENIDYWLPGSETVMDAILTADGKQIIRAAYTPSHDNELLMVERETYQITLTYDDTESFSHTLLSAPGSGFFFTVNNDDDVMAQLYSTMLDYPVKNFEHFYDEKPTFLVGRAVTDRSALIMSNKGDINYIRVPTNKVLFNLRPRKGIYLPGIAVSPDGKFFAVQTASELHIGSIERQNIINIIPLNRTYTEMVDDKFKPHSLTFLGPDKILVSEKDFASEMVDLKTKTSKNMPFFTLKNGDKKRAYSGFNNISYGGGNRWLMAYYDNRIVIIDPIKLRAVKEFVAYGNADTSRIVDLSTSYNQDYILVRTLKGGLFRLRWTGADKATDIPQIF